MKKDNVGPEIKIRISRWHTKKMAPTDKWDINDGHNLIYVAFLLSSNQYILCLRALISSLTIYGELKQKHLLTLAPLF